MRIKLIIVEGRRRKNVIGGFKPRNEQCGPLRDLNPDEVSEQDELEKIEALYRR